MTTFRVFLKIKFTYFVHFKTFRLSQPEQFTLYKTLVQNITDTSQTFDRNHIGPEVRYLIDIYNRGPGYLPLGTVDVKIPLFTKHMKPILYISTVEVNN